MDSMILDTGVVQRYHIMLKGTLIMFKLQQHIFHITFMHWNGCVGKCASTNPVTIFKILLSDTYELGNY